MKLLKRLTFSILALIIIILVVATIIEKIYGTTFALQHIYYSLSFMLLWGAVAILSLTYLIKKKVFRRPITFLLHLSFVVILIGALFTHIYSEEGVVHLRKGEIRNTFIDKDGMGHDMPFSIALEEFGIKYYTSSKIASDYHSSVVITDGDEKEKATISMNNILKYKGYRFYQSGFDGDQSGTTLMVNYDPIGVNITYIGYAILFLTMILLLSSPKSRFRELIKESRIKGVSLIIAILISFPTSAFSENSPIVLPKDVSAKFERICVMYNGRITPLQTIMDNILLKLYGSTSYNGYSSSQVFTGMMLFPDSWEDEKIIKVDNSEIRKLLDFNGKYVSFNNFFDKDENYKIFTFEFGIIRNNPKLVRSFREADEKATIVLNIMEWGRLSKSKELFGKEPDEFNDWLTAVIHSAEQENYSNLDSLIEDLGGAECSSLKLEAELLYNSLRNHTPVAIILVIIGIISFIYFGFHLIDVIKINRWVTYILNSILLFAFVYISILISLRWYIGGHIPLSNGFETMQFMAWSSILITLLLQKRFSISIPFGLLLSGFALMVSTFGESNPQITYLVPVLSSPLLSIHVVVIMLSYSLLAFMMLNGVMAFMLRAFSNDCDNQIVKLQMFSNILLYPALFLLTAGIFIGAIWANISWGRYWAWDPKEVWALITMLIYSLALHQESLPLFKKKMFFHLFTIIAFLSVLFTYFGVNFILGGMHSYA